VPQDRTAEQEPGLHEVSPGGVDISDEGRVRQVDLGQRLERLPVGHPSSPYRDDGSRKPRSPDLTELELPLPDEPNAAVDDRLSEDVGRIRSDGWWEWRGHKLSPEASSAVDQAVAECRGAEGRDADGNYGDHGLTPTMRRIEAQLAYSHLAEDTEQHALKEPDRFKEKLAKLISDEPGSDPTELVTRINDGVRYTHISEEEHYSSGVMEVCASLSDAGFELYERKNAWADNTKSYQGVNSSWLDHESGQLFEVQVHTPASWRAKQESHWAYEVIEATNSSPEERAEATQLQERIFGEVPIPSGVRDITSYRKEGW
jgi:hypothetical protein